MRLRVPLALALASIALLGPSAARADIYVMATDEAGDWGREAGREFAPLGDALGQDLTGAAIDTSDIGVIKFVISVTNLPAVGGVPEATRYLWTFSVNGKPYEIDGKFTNYSRGTCDPQSGKCGVTVDNLEGDPTVVTIRKPRDPGAQPFFVRGDCERQQVLVCREIALVHATFDPAAKTITVPVQTTLFKEPGCLTIAPSSNASFPDDMVVAVPSAYFSVGTGLEDTIPRPDEEEATIFAC